MPSSQEICALLDVDRRDTSIFIHADTAVKFNFDSMKAGVGVTVNILLIGILLLNLWNSSRLEIWFTTMSQIYTSTCDFVLLILKLDFSPTLVNWT